MSGGAIIARQNSYLRTFKKAGATSEKTAKSLSKLGIKPIGIFYRLEKAGVFVKTEEGKYYMDEQKAEAFVERRSKYARLVLVAFAFVLGIIYLMRGYL